MKNLTLTIILFIFSTASFAATLCPGKEKRSEFCPGKEKRSITCPTDGK